MVVSGTIIKYSPRILNSLAPSSNSKLKWTAGAFLFYQDAPVKQATRFGIDANLMMIGDSLFSIINTSTTLKKGFAIYGQATYALSDKLNMSFGLRNDYENQTQSYWANTSVTLVLNYILPPQIL